MKKIFFLLLSAVLLAACSKDDITPVSAITFDQTTTPSSIKVGESVQLTVTITPEGATDKTITWSSSDTDVATVTDAGVVTAKKAGTAIITATASNSVSATWTITVADPNLLPGKFTVAEGKTVQFTKSNLYWDGTAFKFEANQYDYDQGTTSEWTTTYTSTHVSHFYWTRTAAVSYANLYSGDEYDKDSDVPFFAESKGGITVEGTEGLYALSSDEWTYLIKTRTNASSLYKYGVTVAGKTNCLIIAPDGYTGGSIEASYDATAWAAAEAVGLVCLPAAGCRNGSYIYDGGNMGYYWSSSPNGAANACDLLFYSGAVIPVSSDFRDRGYSLRLVK